MMITQEFDFKEGNILKNDLDIAYQEDVLNSGKENFYLKEDLLQVHYANRNILLDVGWYGSPNNTEGNFIVFLIKNNEWDNPFFRRTAESFAELRQAINDAIVVLGSVPS
jgi:hypothetical protein